MKKMSVLLLACACVAGTQSFGRTYAPIAEFTGPYAVFDIQLKGKGLDLLKNKGKVVMDIPGEMATNAVFDAVGIRSRIARGVLVEDLDSGNATFVMIEKGDYNIMSAYINRDSVLAANKMKVTETKTTANFAVSGVRSVDVSLYGEDLTLNCSILGQYVVSASMDESKMEKEDISSKLSYVGFGSGSGYENISSWTNANLGPITSIDSSYGPTMAIKSKYPGYAAPVCVKKVKVKYNNKLSNMLAVAYASGGTNELASVEAVEASMNAYINNKANIDDADFAFASTIY